MREKPAISRVELSRECSLSIATTKRLIDELISQGLISEGETLESHPGRGRKAQGLRLRREFGYALGVEIEPRLLGVTAISFDGSVLWQRDLHPDTSDRERILSTVFDEIQRATNECTARGSGPLMGIGVGVAGLVNARQGTILYCPGLPGWENVELGRMMQERYGTQIVVDDGVRCMALAEKRYASCRNLDTFLFIYIGAGVGTGIVLDNRMYRGKNGISGEFGHITVKEDGPLCTCGNRGCLEAMVSETAILARVRSLLAADVYSSLRDTPSTSLDLDAVCAAALEGDKLANMVVADTEECIGIGVADLINIFDPGAVILAGEVIEGLDHRIIDGVQRTVRRRALHTIAQRTMIVKSELSSNTAALGAATQIIERFLENEILNL